MNRNPRYYRARVQALEHIITNMDMDDQNRKILRSGVFPEFFNQEKWIQNFLKEREISNEPLSFKEITSHNTWFTMHPEKVAGKQVITSSREFPVTIKGTNEDILSTIKKGLSSDFSFKLRLKKQSSTVKLKLLEL